jgi:heptosyltransferase-3
LSDPQRILIVRTDRLGDVILTLPMLALLRSRYPAAFLGMLLNSYTGQIVQGHPNVDALLWIDRQGMPRPGNELLLELRRHAFDAVIVVHPTPRLAWLMFRARIPVRIGTGYRFYSRLFTHQVFEHRKDARYHELEYNIRLLKVLDPSFTEEHLQPEYGLSPDPAAVVRVREKLAALGLQPGEQMVVLHPGSGGSARDWPLERFAVLGTRLVQRPGVRVVVTGGKGEEAIVQRVAGEMERDGVIAFPGTLTLPELAALLSEAALVVANSTGPLHLGAALGTPVVGIYPQLTPMSPRRWGPYTSAKRVLVPDAPADCRECSKGTRCACIESITTEQVLHATLELLQQSTSEGRRSVAHA